MLCQMDYDELPYRSVPYAATQPAQVGALGAVFGLTPKPPARARVLELGCASGGNLIPLALRYPAARFTGVDLAERHVSDGQAMISALGLRNIELRQGDIAQMSFRKDRFDYIIAQVSIHGSPQRRSRQS